MKRIDSVSRIGLGILAGVLALPAFAGTGTLIDDFDDGDLEGWVFEDRTTGQEGAASVLNGMVQMTTPAPVDGALFLAFADSFLTPTYDDGTVTCTLRCDAIGTTAGFFLRSDGVNSSYLAFLATDEKGDGGLIYNRFEDGVLTGLEEMPNAFAVGQAWRLSAAAVGATIELKAWPDGESEPPDAQLVITDTTFSTGGFGIFTSRLVNSGNPLQPLDASFDNVFFRQACPGDLNGDNGVGLSDLSTLLENFGTSPAELSDGDFDGDNDVDLADLSHLLSQFGIACS
ncbi:MAG: hypothetical protein HRF50_09070 [Phycisphaerae bacterium]|jgi:hypothetical protein